MNKKQKAENQLLEQFSAFYLSGSWLSERKAVLSGTMLKLGN